MSSEDVERFREHYSKTIVSLESLVRVVTKVEPPRGVAGMSSYNEIGWLGHGHGMDVWWH